MLTLFPIVSFMGIAATGAVFLITGILLMTAGDITENAMASDANSTSNGAIGLKTGSAVPGSTPTGYKSHVYVPAVDETTPHAYVIKSLTTGTSYYVRIRNIIFFEFYCW